MERIHSDGQPLCKFTGKEVTHLSAKTVQLPEDFLGAPIWPPFHCFGTPIWPPWRHVNNEKNTCLLICVLCIFKFSTLTYRNLWIFYFMSRLTLINVSLMFVLRGNFCSKKYIYCPIQVLLSHYQVNFFFQYEWHSIQLENVELKYNRNHGVHKPQTHRSLEDRPPPPLFLGQAEAWRAGKYYFLEARGPFYVTLWMSGPLTCSLVFFFSAVFIYSSITV